MNHPLVRSALVATTVALAACDLEVQNPNDPESQRVLATPKDAEALLGSYYRRWHTALYGALGNVDGMTAVMSFENYSSLANNCQNARAGIPRPANDNAIGNTCQSEQQRVYFIEGEVTRVASNILNQFNQPGFTLGSVAQNHRAKSFAEFLRGLSLGYLALIYDSAAVVTPGQGAEEPGQLLGYSEVMDAAIVALDSAIVHASAADAVGGINIPQTWIPTSDNLTMPSFIRLIRSYRARFRANVARTSVERAAVDWTAVIADAQNGITATHDNKTDPTNGPLKTWVSLWQTTGLWHQMAPFIVGMADTSGSYDAWIALPLDQRGVTGGVYFMITPDLRFPQGGTRAAQQADFTIQSCEAPASRCKRYFLNRPSGNDQSAGLSWGQSNYDFVRYHSWLAAGDANVAQEGSIPFFTLTELNMLEAEGHIRSGNFAAAATLINRTRTAGMVNNIATGGGLPAVLGTVSGGLTGPDCVPRVPVNALPSGGATTTCGDLMEAMKYEKRLETIQSHFAAWFLDSRGWGDLAVGTPLQWAVPYQDLQARRLPIYSMGTGTTGGSSAIVGTYGW